MKFIKLKNAILNVEDIAEIKKGLANECIGLFKWKDYPSIRIRSVKGFAEKQMCDFEIINWQTYKYDSEKERDEDFEKLFKELENEK